MRAQFSALAVLCLTLFASVSAKPTLVASTSLVKRDGRAVSGNSGEANGASVHVGSNGGPVLNRHSNVANGGGLSRTGSAQGGFDDGEDNDDDDDEGEGDRNSDFISFAIKRSDRGDDDGDARSGDSNTANGASVKVDGGGGNVRNIGSNRADGAGRSITGSAQGGEDHGNEDEDLTGQFGLFQGFKRDDDARSGNSGQANGASVSVGSGGGRVINENSNRAQGGGESVTGNAEGGNDPDSRGNSRGGDSRDSFFDDF